MDFKTKIAELLGGKEYSFSAQPTHENSIFFTVKVNGKSFYIEFFIDDKDYVLTAFEGKKLIATTDGNISHVIATIAQYI